MAYLKGLMNRKNLGIIWALTLIVVFVFSVVPVTLPLPIHPYVTDFYNTISALTPGSKVFYFGCLSGYAVAEAESQQLLIVTYLKQHNISVFYVSGRNPDADPILQGSLNKVYGNPFRSNPLYGKQFVYLGWMPDVSAAFMAVAVNIRSTFANDYYGTPLDNLPMMVGINSANELRLAIDFYGQGDTPVNFPAVFYTQYKVKTLWCTSSAGTAQRGVELWIQGGSGPISGMLFGSLSGAELEVLVGITTGNSGFQIAYVGVTIWLILASGAALVYSYAKGEEEKEKT